MNKFKKIIEELGLSFPKEIMKLVFINLFFFALCFLIYFLKLENFYYIVVVVFLLLGDYLFINSYFSRYQVMLYQHDDEMIALFSYFQVFISNHIPIYSAFTNLLNYASDYMKEKITLLLKEIDNDKSVQPFIHFSKHFQNLVFESLCISLYQMVDEGESLEKNNEFIFLFNEVSQSNTRRKMDKKKRSLDILASFPLFGSGIITVTLTLSIVSSIGGMINVF